MAKEEHMNRTAFFASIRKNPFGGSLTQPQVMGIDAILDECEKQNVKDLRHVAYILATPMIETGGSFEPITESLNYSSDALRAKFPNRISASDAEKYGRNSQHPANQEMIGNIIYGGEWGKKNLGNTQAGDGFKYRGRGLSQVTGRRLYEIFGYADKPDEMAHIKASAYAMAKAMKEGTFTGVKLSDFINATKEDWNGARKTVNGTDRAADIAKHAKTFYAALKEAS